MENLKDITKNKYFLKLRVCFNNLDIHLANIKYFFNLCLKDALYILLKHILIKNQNNQ